MIHPTNGRVVWYNPSEQDLRGRSDPPMAVMRDSNDKPIPLAATVVAVHHSRRVNLDVIDASGRHYARTEVILKQVGDKDIVADNTVAYAEWMPYQLTQAAKARDKELTLREKIEQIAKVCHEANRGYCQALGDNSQPTWEDAPLWQKESAMVGVQLHLNNPDAGPEESHVSWLRQKSEEGWVYGPIKDPIAKQHPCMVPFSQLPVEQQAKDFIFRAVVHALS